MIADRQMPAVSGDQFGYGQGADRDSKEEFVGSRSATTEVCWVAGVFRHLPPSMFAGGTKQPFSSKFSSLNTVKVHCRRCDGVNCHSRQEGAHR